MLYGWDVSTSIIGLACFTNDGKFERTFHLDLRKVDGMLAKADAFREWLGGFLYQRGLENHHFIEERLGGFAGGRTSAQVIMKLGQFNAIVSYILWTHDPGPHRQITYLHPSTWKSIMKREGLLIPKGSDKKKELTLAFVRRQQPEFEGSISLNRNDKPQPWCYDMADAWCIGRSGFRRLCSVGNESSQPSDGS